MTLSLSYLVASTFDANCLINRGVDEALGAHAQGWTNTKPLLSPHTPHICHRRDQDKSPTLSVAACLAGPPQMDAETSKERGFGRS